MAFLDDKEWYDNHRIAMMLNCPRKAFYHLIGPQALLGLPAGGLAHGVGDGANFGTCIHAALASYYGRWDSDSEPRRRLYAFANYKRVWDAYFGARGSELKSAHQLHRGLDILTDYFDRFMHEDRAYRPLDPELSFAVEIDPQRYGLGGNPFWFVGRTDGIFRREFDGDLVVNEYKTTGSGVSRRLLSLKRSRQGRGYVGCMRLVPGGERITGFMGVVILVAADKRECDRDYFPISQQVSDSWIRQTIRIVNDWRWKIALCEAGRNPLDVFVENDEECFNYGQCSFYNLCQYGITHEELSEMALDEWSPLNYTKEHPTETVAVDKAGDVARGITLWSTK